MKKLIYLFWLIPALVFGQASAGAGHVMNGGSNAPDAGGDVVGPSSSTNNAWALWDGTTGKLLKDSNVTYSGGVMSVPDAFNVSSAGAISLTAGGSNKNVTIAPSGTSNVIIPYQAYLIAPPFVGVTVVSPNATESGFLVDGFGDGNTPRFVGRTAGGTPSSPTAVANGRTLVGITGRAHDGTSYSGTSVGLGGAAAETWTSTAHGTRINIFYVPKGATATRDAIVVNSSSHGVLQFGHPNATTDIDVAGFTATSIGLLSSFGDSNTLRNATSATNTTLDKGVANSFNTPTFSATNTGITYTNAANLYISGDVTAGTNVTLTNTYGLWNVGKTRLDGNILYGGIMQVSTDTLSGAGAVSVTKDTTKLTSTGVAQAITLANGVDGQIKRIIHDVDGGSMVLTPTTKTGWSTATFTNAGDSLTLEYVATRGWIVMGSYGTVIAP